MEEIRYTQAGYEADADAYVDKYLSESVADLFGDAFLDEVDGRRLLDIGCGPGADIEPFLGAGYDVTGLDITRPFLRAASDHVPEATLVQGDMRRLPFGDGTFDGVWASASFHHVPERAAISALEECGRVLRPSGVAFVSVKREGFEKPADRDRHFEYYRPEAFREMVGNAGLEVVDFVTGENWISVLVAPGNRE